MNPSPIVLSNMQINNNPQMNRLSIPKIVILVAIILVLIAFGSFRYYRKYSAPTNQAFQPTNSAPANLYLCQILQEGSADVPPLFKEVTWEQPKMTEREVPLGEQGNKQKKGCLIKSQQIPFEIARKASGFYIENLPKLNWQLIDAADGPGGTLVTYQKGKRYFLVDEHQEPRFLPPDTPIPAPERLPIVELFYIDEEFE